MHNYVEIAIGRIWFSYGCSKKTSCSFFRGDFQ